MLDLRRLRLLRELADRGTLAAVADATGYTPSAVSQQLAVLQREAGVTLMEPAGRGVRLTDAGRVLAAHAAELLAGVERAEADLQAAAARPAGTVRVAAFQTALLALVAPAVGALAEQHPAVVVEVADLELEEALPALRTGAVDVALGDEYEGQPRPRPAGTVRRTLLREEVRLFLPPAHPLAARARVPLAGLAAAVWAGTRPGTGHRAMHVAACRRAGFEPDLRHSSSDLLVLLELVRRAGAVALLPDLVGRPDGVEVRDLEDERLGREVFALTREAAAGRPAVAAVLDALAAAAGPR